MAVEDASRMRRRSTQNRAGSRSRLPLLIGGILALSGAAACGGGSGSSTPTATPRSTTASSGAAAQGQALYASKGCKSCHSIDGSAGVGPTWKGLAGSRVKLADASMVTADDAYLTASIEDPDKQIVDGYKPGVMTASIPKDSISPADARALVGYIKSLQ
jgi:cytochrome c oxidase subunit 2